MLRCLRPTKAGLFCSFALYFPRGWILLLLRERGRERPRYSRPGGRRYTGSSLVPLFPAFLKLRADLPIRLLSVLRPARDPGRGRVGAMDDLTREFLIESQEGLDR